MNGDTLSVVRTDCGQPRCTVWAMDLAVPCNKVPHPDVCQVGASTQLTKNVNVPPNTTVPSSFVPKDAPYSFDLLAEGTKLKVARTDCPKCNGWPMDLAVPCLKDFPDVCTIGGSGKLTKIVDFPNGTKFPETCGRGCRLNTENVDDAFSIVKDGDGKFKVKRIDCEESLSCRGWGIDLKVPCKKVEFPDTCVVGPSSSVSKEVDIPEGTKVKPICGPDCHGNNVPDKFVLATKGNKVTAKRIDCASADCSWAYDLKVPCKKP